MIRWEYKEIWGERELESWRLDALGADGWEMTGVVLFESQLVYYFKRPLPAEGS